MIVTYINENNAIKTVAVLRDINKNNSFEIKEFHLIIGITFGGVACTFEGCTELEKYIIANNRLDVAKDSEKNAPKKYNFKDGLVSVLNYEKKVNLRNLIFSRITLHFSNSDIESVRFGFNSTSGVNLAMNTQNKILLVDNLLVNLVGYDLDTPLKIVGVTSGYDYAENGLFSFNGEIMPKPLTVQTLFEVGNNAIFEVTKDLVLH